MTPIGNKLIIEPIEEPHSSLILVHKPVTQKAKVISVGKKVNEFSAGDTIMIPYGIGTKIENQFIIKEEEVIGKYE